MQDELDKFEDGLRQISPAAPPSELMEQLRAATTRARPAVRPVTRRAFGWADLLTSWRGLAVSAPAAAVIVIAWLALRPESGLPDANSSGSLAGKADAVQVGHVLLASFDTVAQMPDGEPVRFRCREWQDDVVIHDHARGMVISQSTPRVEVIPVRFETY